MPEATVRRQTEAAGAAYVAVQTHEVEQREREAPPAPQGPAQQFTSVDGAFVPLVGGEWAEVKTLAIGEVEPPRQVDGETVIQTDHLSYFSRLTNATTFQRAALVETHRCGVETAKAVCAVTDGSEWCQNFTTFHRAEAVRILDFSHAGEHVAQIGQAVSGGRHRRHGRVIHAPTPAPQAGGPDSCDLGTPSLTGRTRRLTAVGGPMAYLDKRVAQMQYPAFLATGWPIGDGAVENANKLIVDARLKGSGMHWARPHFDPLLALRNLACNDRWAEGGPQIVSELRRQTRHRSDETRKERCARCDANTLLTRPPEPEPTAGRSTPAEPSPPSADTPVSVAKPMAEKPKGPYRPSVNHPWRKLPAVLKTKRQLAQLKRP